MKKKNLTSLISILGLIFTISSCAIHVLPAINDNATSGDDLTQEQLARQAMEHTPLNA